jgi:hypothetical protein
MRAILLGSLYIISHTCFFYALHFCNHKVSIRADCGPHPGNSREEPPREEQPRETKPPVCQVRIINVPGKDN